MPFGLNPAKRGTIQVFAFAMMMKKRLKWGKGKRVRDNFCFKIYLINVSIPNQIDKGLGIFISGNDPTIGQD